MDIEGIMLSKMRQARKDKNCMSSLVCAILKTKSKKSKKKKKNVDKEIRLPKAEVGKEEIKERCSKGTSFQLEDK